MKWKERYSISTLYNYWVPLSLSDSQPATVHSPMLCLLTDITLTFSTPYRYQDPTQTAVYGGILLRPVPHRSPTLIHNNSCNNSALTTILALPFIVHVWYTCQRHTSGSGSVICPLRPVLCTRRAPPRKKSRCAWWHFVPRLWSAAQPRRVRPWVFSILSLPQDDSFIALTNRI